MSNTRDWIAVLHDYQRNPTGKNRWIKLQCEKLEREYLLAKDPSFPFYFSEDECCRVCDFASSLRYIEDGTFNKAQDNIDLLPWQVSYLGNLFGWRRKADDLKRFRRAFLFCARGNGKSLTGSVSGLYVIFVSGIRGAQGVCAASNEPQARIVLDGSRRFVKQEPELCDALHLDVMANAIKQPTTGNRLWCLPAKASSSEGLSLDFAHLDELHLSKGRSLYDSLQSGTLKRGDGLFQCHSTAGIEEGGICAELMRFTQRQLLGEVVDDETLGYLYCADESDPWDGSEEVIAKANPGLHKTVSLDAIISERNRAMQMPSAKSNYLMKHLNIFVQGGANAVFLDPRDIRRCYDPKLNESDLVGQPCVVGGDLASVWDMCAVVTVFAKRGADKKVNYSCFLKAFLPKDRKDDLPAYADWEKAGELVFTDLGRSTDLDEVERHIMQRLDKFAVRDISLDMTQASQIITHVEKRKPNVCVGVPQNGKSFTPGLNELQAALLDGRLKTPSKLLIWCLGNLRTKEVGSSLRVPIRPDASKKIDGAVALAMCLRSTFLKPLDEMETSVYSTRGILSLDWEDGSITDALTGANAPRYVEAQPVAPEPPREGFTRIRMRGDGTVKWLPNASINYLVECGAAELC